MRINPNLTNVLYGDLLLFYVFENKKSYEIKPVDNNKDWINAVKNAQNNDIILFYDAKGDK